MGVGVLCLVSSVCVFVVSGEGGEGLRSASAIASTIQGCQELRPWVAAGGSADEVSAQVKTCGRADPPSAARGPARSTSAGPTSATRTTDPALRPCNAAASAGPRSPLADVGERGPRLGGRERVAPLEQLHGVAVG